MLQCWSENPQDRPNFSDIVTKLEPAHQKIYVDFNDLGPNYVFPPMNEEFKMKKELEDLKNKKESDAKSSHKL